MELIATSDLHPYLQERAEQLAQLCIQFGIRRLYVFGSLAAGTFRPDSDVDLIADIDDPDPICRGKRILDFYMALEQLFDRPVDLITNYDQLRNPYLLQGIEEHKQLIYALQAEVIAA